MMLDKNTTINFFNHVYLPQVGGLERYTASFSDELTKLGYKVNIITTDSHNLGTVALEKGKIVYRLKAINLLNGRFPIPFSIYQFYKVYKHLFKDEEILVILNSRLFLTSLLGLFLGKISGSKIVLIEHGSSHIDYSNKFLVKAFELYEHFVSFIYKHSNIEFYGVSKAGNDWLTHFGIEAKGTINNGIVENTHLKESNKAKVKQKDSFLAEYKINNKKTITYAGRLIYEKGILELIQAFNTFNKSHKGYQLVLIGRGELENKIIKASTKNKNIHYLGILEHNDVLRLFSESTIFINPSNYPEGLPTTILEAGYLGAPVISTPNGGAKEVIIDNKTGMLIESGTYENILNALTQFTMNSPKYIKMAANLKTLIKKDYMWHKITKRFVKNIQIHESPKLYFNLDLNR